uniref:Uncharacterized protein n=1 Tax=Parascaris equorum TaxID=6256 RepID=A0A914R627_PAREQ
MMCGSKNVGHERLKVSLSRFLLQSFRSEFILLSNICSLLSHAVNFSR